MSKRILITSLLITLFILLVFAFTSNELYYAQTEGDATSHLVEKMSALEESEETPDDAGRLSDMLDIDVTVFGDGGKVLSSSLPEVQEGATPDSGDIAEAAAADGNYVYTTPSAIDGHTYVHVCRNIGGTLVRLTAEIISRSRVLVTMLPNLAIFILIDLVVCLLFTWLSTTFILRPVKEFALDAIGNDKKIETKYTELKPVADVINWKNEYVRAAQKSKDEFISNVTHEMNTPLTSIRGFAELIASGNMPQDKMIAAGKTISAQSERLSAMIKQILNYSAIDDDTVKSYDVDISRLIGDVLDNFEPMLKEKGLTMLRRIDENVIIESTHERITEILDNLVSNAIKYNKPNGSIIVTLRGAVLTVEDTGIGIAHDELPHIFSRFYTVDKSHGESVGFGLGLPIVRKLCDRSGWELSVDSVKGAGTVFTVGFGAAKPNGSDAKAKK